MRSPLIAVDASVAVAAALPWRGRHAAACAFLAGVFAWPSLALTADRQAAFLRG